MTFPRHVGGERLMIDSGQPDPKAVYEPEAELGWLIDREDYRVGGGQWEFTPIDKLPGATKRGRKVVELAELLGESGTGLPRVRIEPAPEEHVRVSASVKLVVQAYGETSSIEADQAAVVPYGSVVRAGPLLLAPLYEEQAASVHSGAMTLPRPGGGFFDEGDRLTALDVALPKNPRRWILWAWGALWGLSYPAVTVLLFLMNSADRGGYVSGRTFIYTIGSSWMLLSFVGWGIHHLVSRFVHAGEPEIPD